MRSSPNVPLLHLAPVGTTSPPAFFGSGSYSEGHPLLGTLMCSPGKSQGKEQTLPRKLRGTITPVIGARPQAARAYDQMEAADTTLGPAGARRRF